MTRERIVGTLSGWLVLPLLIALTIGGGFLIAERIKAIVALVNAGDPFSGAIWLLVLVSLAELVVLAGFFGFFTLQPNEAGVLLLFGKYSGTVRHAGFHWVNPLIDAKKLSMRTRNFNSDKLKVNDHRGNPTEIGAVVVWRVDDSAQACFDVDDYQNYVHIQSESALRHLASRYPYDANDENTISLRGSIDEVSAALKQELQDRLDKAGVVVEEARLSHLAYAPEIAGAMLRRQQAEAIVAARYRIVEGAVGMVETALERLAQRQTVQLDEERKAAMVSNLLVVLCGEQAATPVVNAGTLYT